MKKTLVIYHAGCSDGFGAAWSAYRYFTSQEDPVEVEYRAFYHNYRLPLDLEDFQCVYIVDFSFKADVILELCNRLKEAHGDASEVYLIDHHKTAVDEIAKLENNCPSNLHVTFDMEKSGAVLTWEHFFPTKDVPQVLQYVQDRDLWNWNLPDSEAISAVISVTPYEWKDWDNLFLDLEDAGQFLVIEEGEAMLRLRDTLVERLVKKAGFTRLPGYEEHLVPCVNSSLFQSEIGNELCKEYPYAVIYFIKADGVCCYSLRSDSSRPDEVVDVAKIAESFGGGGHRHAAGFMSEDLPPVLKQVEES